MGRRGRRLPDDERLLEHLDQTLRNEKSRRLLFIARYSLIPKLNLGLLDLLPRRQQRQGIYLSIDRPHKFMDLLLRKRDIPRAKLTYVDLVTKGTVGGDRVGDVKALLSVGGFFWLKLMTNTFEQVFDGSTGNQTQVKLEDASFLLLDNLSVMPAYNSESSIREFFQELRGLLERHEKLQVFLITHGDIHPTMLSILKEFSDRVVKLEGAMA